MSPNQDRQPFWATQPNELFKRLRTTADGLTTEESKIRLAELGPNLLKKKRRTDPIALFVSQFRSPIILILLIAAAISFFLADRQDAVIILVIVFASGFLGFLQERRAADAVAGLTAMVQIKATVLRDGNSTAVPVEEIVPGDVILLAAGDSIPGDCLIFESKDLFVDEAALTGETYPAEKAVGMVPSDSPLAKRSNALFMGTHVVSGMAKAVVVLTGRGTEFGKVSDRLRLRPPETEFERGVRRFGFFLMEVTLMLVVAIFAINVYLSRPVLNSFLFSLALAVGLTPQLLPAIISINLAHGARKMAESQVIVKRLSSIENFGSMNVLCSDKTGTLTQGVVELRSALDNHGDESEKVLLYAYINSYFQTGFTNPIDVAIRKRRPSDLSGVIKLDEVPYDFVRKRLSVLVEQNGKRFIITKGAFEKVLGVCSSAEDHRGERVELAGAQEKMHMIFEDLGTHGYRVLGIAYRNMGEETSIAKDSEREMTFLGFLVFYDPPKRELAETIRELSELGITLKVITGDNRLVASVVVQEVGIKDPIVVTGSELSSMSDEALFSRVDKVDVFAEVEPNQKERIIRALQKTKNVVGYMGDGINDASALHAADVGISVDSAVDVAKDAADIVLLKKDLGVLLEGTREGRTTFANTLKYVFMATSANFGNMFSMAGASLFLSFLPLLPKQVLLTNLLTDFPETTIATDTVDPEMVREPRRWDIGFIRRFMLVFGIISSVFDFLMFAALVFLLNASVIQFRTAWLLESVISASVIVLVIRTRRPFFRSLPAKQLLIATVTIIGVALLLPYALPGSVFDFEALPVSFPLVIGLIVVLYVLVAEFAKRMFYRSSWAR